MEENMPLDPMARIQKANENFEEVQVDKEKYRNLGEALGQAAEIEVLLRFIEKDSRDPLALSIQSNLKAAFDVYTKENPDKMSLSAANDLITSSYGSLENALRNKPEELEALKKG